MNKQLLLLPIFLIVISAVLAQPKTDKVFWKEDFASGKLPKGWITVAANDSSTTWFVTDQPFPGSYGRNYQAPPIASESRGYHIQIAPGVKVGKNVKKWKKTGIFPEAYIQTEPINCSGHNSVVLKFQQNFFWNDWELPGKKPELIAAVSNNGKDWTEYEVHNGIGAGEDCPNPMNVELNITRVAAQQKTVYLRFWWRKMFQWYWMIDDISLSEAFDSDLLALDLHNRKTEGNTFSANDSLVFRVVNLGAKPVTESMDCYLQIDQRPLLKTVIQASVKKPFGIIDTAKVVFRNLDLSDVGVHKVKFYTSQLQDLRRTNDTLVMELYSQACELGDITNFRKESGKEYTISCHKAQLKVQFLRNDMFRIWMAYDGIFTNPAGKDLIINSPDENVNAALSETSDYYLLTTPETALRIYKKPLRFALYRGDNSTQIWEEPRGITYGKQTVQYLKRGEKEQFFGGGMQNGRFSHRDKTIRMTIDYNWEDGGNPNPATFYMSSNGYGAVRNTYATGEYSFKDTLKLVQDESRFDCYYFVSNSLKETLSDYTDLTGKPFLMPRWALGMGDANCYNRGAKSGKTVGSTSTGFDGITPSVIPLIADKYIENKMPTGWILPNDGYGCGYTDLDVVIPELRKRGFYTGLWTENGVEKIAKEVGEYGSRLCKLDVAWVGPGFKFAIDGAKTAYEGIEKNSDARGFVWQVCGWTGSHRNAVLWTGDQSGSWNYIRWHIPTVIGSGLSAQNCATGDVDGIFGGSDSTYVRDLQWKCFTPAFMTMSGWATNNKNGIKDKQPWLFGEPFTSINRKYLQLKQRLTPYMYTLCANAYQTGTPAVRGLVLEYPEDPATWGNAAKYEFLLGKDLLVAPVYKSEAKRDSIYLPKGKWIDFWDGTAYNGNTTLMGYLAPLEKLPLFVRSGAIIPMNVPMRYNWERPADTLTVNIFPEGKSEYTMYEDDGLTRQHREGAFATTKFEVSAPENEKQPVEITINATKGDFSGRLKERTYQLDVFTDKLPKSIVLNGQKLKKTKDKASFDNQDAVWYFDPADRRGIVHIKTSPLSTDVNTALSVKYE
jgi:alpha-glucosidase (family GH31 glycosyl hydrolase)